MTFVSKAILLFGGVVEDRGNMVRLADGIVTKKGEIGPGAINSVVFDDYVDRHTDFGKRKRQQQQSGLDFKVDYEGTARLGSIVRPPKHTMKQNFQEGDPKSNSQPQRVQDSTKSRARGGGLPPRKLSFQELQSLEGEHFLNAMADDPELAARVAETYGIMSHDTTKPRKMRSMRTNKGSSNKSKARAIGKTDFLDDLKKGGVPIVSWLVLIVLIVAGLWYLNQMFAGPQAVRTKKKNAQHRRKNKQLKQIANGRELDELEEEVVAEVEGAVAGRNTGGESKKKKKKRGLSAKKVPSKAKENNKDNNKKQVQAPLPEASASKRRQENGDAQLAAALAAGWEDGEHDEGEWQTVRKRVEARTNDDGNTGNTHVTKTNGGHISKNGIIPNGSLPSNNTSGKTNESKAGAKKALNSKTEPSTAGPNGAAKAVKDEILGARINKSDLESSPSTKENVETKSINLAKDIAASEVKDESLEPKIIKSDVESSLSMGAESSLSTKEDAKTNSNNVAKEIAVTEVKDDILETKIVKSDVEISLSTKVDTEARIINSSEETAVSEVTTGEAEPPNDRKVDESTGSGAPEIKSEIAANKTTTKPPSATDGDLQSTSKIEIQPTTTTKQEEASVSAKNGCNGGVSSESIETTVDSELCEKAQADATLLKPAESHVGAKPTESQGGAKPTESQDGVVNGKEAPNSKSDEMATESEEKSATKTSTDDLSPKTEFTTESDAQLALELQSQEERLAQISTPKAAGGDDCNNDDDGWEEVTGRRNRGKTSANQ